MSASPSALTLTLTLLSLSLAAGVAVPSFGEVAVAHEEPSQFERDYRSGKAARGDKDARRHYQRGIDGARGVLGVSPDAPDALLWLAANLAGEALTHGRVYALGVISEIESTLLRLEAVHPRYDHAAAARALASLYWKAPALISVGSSRKATQYFQLALGRAPEFPGNQAMAAAYFAEQGDCARARPLAQAVVAARSDLDKFGPDAAEWRELADAALRRCSDD